MMTSEERHDAREADMEYWGLDLPQQVSYLGRISEYYGKASAREAEKSEVYAKKAIRAWVIAGVFWLIAVAAQAIGAIL